MSSSARPLGDAGSVLRPSRSSQILKASDDGANPKQTRPTRHHHLHGLPKPNLAPLHRSSSPSAVVSPGKENGNHQSPYPVVARHSQPPANILRHQRSGNLRNSAETPDARQGQASPRAGIREEATRQKTYPSRPGSDHQKDQDAEGINRDFEKLLEKFQLPATVRSRLTPLDTPLKKSLLCSPIALQSLLGSDAPFSGSPGRSATRPNNGSSRPQSSFSSQVAQPCSPQYRRAKSTTHEIQQVRPMRSVSSLREREPGVSESSLSTAGRKTEYVDNAKFVVLNGSPVRQVNNSRRPGTSPTKAGNRSSYLHTSEGIPVPPLDHLDSEYDFMRDFSRGTASAELSGTASSINYAKTTGTSSSNSSAGSRGSGGNGRLAEREKQRKQKRSSVFSTKTKGSKKDGYKTDDCAIEETGKDKKRKSYTFGQAFAKSKASNIDDQILPATKFKDSKTPSGLQREDGDLPLALAGFLRDAETFEMDIDKVKRLRFLLASERTSWIEAFLHAGGYIHLLARLQDLLDIEWRSEQHDDQLFFEILRCIKGLTTSDPGKAAIISHGEHPFRALMDLLYSEKKPGEVPPKHLIVDLVSSLFDLYRPSGNVAPNQPRNELRSRSNDVAEVNNYSRHISISPEPTLSADVPRTGGSQNRDIPGGYDHISGFVLCLLRSSPPEKEKALETTGGARADRNSRIVAPASELPVPKVEIHDFLAVAHKTRIFQTYLKELSQACWDFFWIMHYSKNGIWDLREVDVDSIKPKAPTGAWGVEMEAIRYLTSHFRLLNTLGRTLLDKDMEDEVFRQDLKKGQASQFFEDMMFSGMDRILCTVRKASTDLYPEFHLEIARYLKIALEAEYALPYVVKALITPPPDRYRKVVDRDTRQRQRQTQSPRPRATYIKNGSPHPNHASQAVPGTTWLATPTDIGEFDFQL